MVSTVVCMLASTPASFGGAPQHNVEIQPRNARGGRFDRRGNDVAIEEQAGFGNSQCTVDQIGRAEQTRQKADGFGRNELAANALAGKLSAFEQKYAGARAGGGDGGGSSRRTARR